MIPGLVAAFCALKPFWRTIPSVIPMTAGPMAAPATAVAIWLVATQTQDCEASTAKDARMVQMPVMITTQRLRVVWSMKAPAGVVISIPAIPPAVMTVPIGPGVHPFCCRKTPRKGPIPAWRSAMKKLSACSASLGRRPTGGGACGDVSPVTAALSFPVRGGVACRPWYPRETTFGVRNRAGQLGIDANPAAGGIVIVSSRLATAQPFCHLGEDGSPVRGG